MTLGEFDYFGTAQPERKGGEEAADIFARPNLDDEARPPVFEVKLLLARCMNDVPFLQNMLTMFAERLPRELTRTRELLVSKEGEQLCRLAHTLKGLTGILAAQRLSDLFHTLEREVRAGQWEQAEAIGDALHAEVRCCLEAIPRIREEVHRLPSHGHS